MAIVMGLDQHRAQITAEWIETETGEVSRGRIAPANRESVRGFLSRQGPPTLRWALYEAAQVALRPGSPDRDYYLQAAARLGNNRALLAVTRKLLKRCYHTLKDLGEDALAPA